MLLILLIIEYVCTPASALALHTCLFFLCSVHVEQSRVCVLRSLARPSHLSLLCIRCMWERASGKSPHYFNAAYFPAPHSGLFLSLLWHETEENPQCVCACVRAHVCVRIRPRTSSPLMLQWEAFIARRTPDWQACWTPTHTHTHDVTHSQMLSHTWAAHM